MFEKIGDKIALHNIEKEQRRKEEADRKERERKEEAERIERERQAEINRLMGLTEKELMVEIIMSFKSLDKRYDNLEQLGKEIKSTCNSINFDCSDIKYELSNR